MNTEEKWTSEWRKYIEKDMYKYIRRMPESKKILHFFLNTQIANYKEKKEKRYKNDTYTINEVIFVHEKENYHFKKLFYELYDSIETEYLIDGNFDDYQNYKGITLSEFFNISKTEGRILSDIIKNFFEKNQTKSELISEEYSEFIRKEEKRKSEKLVGFKIIKTYREDNKRVFIMENGRKIEYILKGEVPFYNA